MYGGEGSCQDILGIEKCQRFYENVFLSKLIQFFFSGAGGVTISQEQACYFEVITDTDSYKWTEEGYNYSYLCFTALHEAA